MDAYEANREFEVAAMPAVKDALQRCAAIVWGRAMEKLAVTSLQDATHTQDWQEATDLKMAFISSGGRTVDIAARVRRHDYWQRGTRGGVPYREQFTVRRQSKYGGRTEITKVLAGFGTFMLYGFESQGGTDRLVQFTIIDLDVFRQCVVSWPKTTVSWDDVPNPGDGTRGAAFNLADFPPRLVVCRYDADRGGLTVPTGPAVLPTVSCKTAQGVLF